MTFDRLQALFLKLSPKQRVTSSTLEVSIQEMTSNEETKSNTKREDSNRVCAENP